MGKLNDVDNMAPKNWALPTLAKRSLASAGQTKSGWEPGLGGGRSGWGPSKGYGASKCGTPKGGGGWARRVRPKGGAPNCGAPKRVEP